MRTDNPVIAIACSDIHLSHKPPIARAGEKNWWKAMRRPLKEIRDLQCELNVPVICAGDIFHHWKAPPELINFALDRLPDMLTIAGQHDLPMHRLDHLHQSALYTLVRAAKLSMVEVKYIGARASKGMSARFAFYSWGQSLEHAGSGRGLRVAVQHRFVWMNRKTYPGAPKSGNVKRVARELSRLGYHIGIFGDNHQGFIWTDSKTHVMIVNCGSIMRRKIDEVNERPFVALIYANGRVMKHYLDIGKDVIAKPTSKIEQRKAPDLHDFLESLEDLSSTPFDFVEAMKQALERDDIKKDVRETITKAIDHARSK